MCPVRFIATGFSSDGVTSQDNPSSHPMCGLQVPHTVLVCVINQSQQLALLAKKAIFHHAPPHHRWSLWWFCLLALSHFSSTPRTWNLFSTESCQLSQKPAHHITSQYSAAAAGRGESKSITQLSTKSAKFVWADLRAQLEQNLIRIILLLLHILPNG